MEEFIRFHGTCSKQGPDIAWALRWTLGGDRAPAMLPTQAIPKK
jgi:hypothetical protein